MTAVFSFPSTATNASFVLRKYYVSLLHHYEQIYFFKAQGWAPISAGVCIEHSTFICINVVRLLIISGKLCADASQSPSITPVPSHGLAEPVLPSPESQPAGIQQQRISSADIFPGGLFFSVFLFASHQI